MTTPTNNNNQFISVRISKKEQAAWRQYFADYGTKEACHQATKVSKGTITNIIKNGGGLIGNVEKIRWYVIQMKAVKKAAEEAVERAALELAEQAAKEVIKNYSPTIAA